ncbi:MAG: TIGR02099 family protein [Ramlibacter sp.]|nr:TIGR02099 family protein [Ramlibacter sp.]
MNDSPPSPSRLLKTYAAIARWFLWLLLTVWLVFALAWGALHGWIVPRIGEFRPDLEIEATRVLGVPVRIGEITARTEGLVPSFELANVVLLDPQGREALRLPRVVAALSPRSLWNLGFEQLYIDRPELDVRRGADGRIYVAGLDFSRGGGDGRAADWFFSQTEFVIHQGTVRWTDELRGTPPLALAAVDFVARNSARRHAMRLDATPPAQWGQRFTLRGQFRQPLWSVRAGQWTQWDGQLHADFAQVDVSRLRGRADLGVDLTEGRGALRLWADVRKGEITGGVADVALTDVSGTLGARLQPLSLAFVSGRVGGQRLPGGFDFATQNLQFKTREGLAWPGGNVAVTWTGASGSRPAQGELRADRLDLAALGQIASRLPLGTATHAALAAYAPRGVVETLQGRWQGAPEAPVSYQARGRVVGLEVASRAAGLPADASAARAAPGTPGIRGAALDFDFTQAGGTARLHLSKGALDLPGVFEDPLLLFDDLSADARWQINGRQLSLSVDNMKFSNADLEGQARLSWQTGDPSRSASHSRFPGVLDLQGTLSRADGARVHRYLPQVIAASARHYVREAVVHGQASGVKFRVRGDLTHLPFNDPKLGEFRISANVKNTEFAFVPRTLAPRGTAPWPALTQLSGELIFEGNTMQVRGASGKLTGAPGLQVTRAEALIPDLAHSTTVVVSADVRGPLSEALAVVNASPLSALMGHALDKTTASGNAEVRLNLTLPVNTIDRSRVQGSVTLAGNDLQITPDSPVLSRARGSVLFSETGFSLVGTQARALGGDLRLEGGSRPSAGPSEPASVQFRAQGAMTAEGLRQASELGFVSRLAQSMQGSATYTAALGFRRGVPELSIASSLQGLAVNLPPPLNKGADTALPLRYDSALLAESLAPGAALGDQVVLGLGRIASVSYVRDLSAPVARVRRGAIGVGLAAGEAAPLPEQGVMANVNLGTVDVDAWEKVLSGASGTSVTTSADTAGAANRAALEYLPTVLAVRADALALEGRTLHNVVVGGSREGLVWRANVDADELNGYLEYRQPSGAGAGRVYARLARLSIAASAAREVEQLLDEQPANIPALDVVVDELELRGKRLGRAEIDAVNRGGSVVAREGGVREWRLNKLNLVMPEAHFSATGNWAALNAQAAAPGGPRPPRVPGEVRRTVMNFRLDIADSGQLLTRFGMKDVIRRGKGRMEGQVAWLGSPLTMDYPSLSGAFNVNVEGGQFLKADPGLAKLLGVLSLQSLPRRLTLDFRDVFSEGFAFDFVRGDVTIQQGIAATNNLQMKGVNAAVLMDGRADIARETQDLRVVVVPEINAGTASLVATVINPVVGLGTFLAQMVLRNPLIRATTQEFHIDGTWADPRVVRVDRKPPADSKIEAGDASRPAVTQ